MNINKFRLSKITYNVEDKNLLEQGEENSEDLLSLIDEEENEEDLDFLLPKTPLKQKQNKFDEFKLKLQK